MSALEVVDRMDLFGWVFLLGGLFGLATAHYRWYESELWQAMDWFSVHSSLDQKWIGGGLRRFYYTTGWLFVLLGLCLFGISYFRRL
jgi:hypothetical protein